MADAPKIQIDSDWKAQAQAEKEKLAQQAKGSETLAGASAGARGGMPAANFETLVSTLVTQTLFALGVIGDRSGQRVVHLDLARHHIDMLDVLEKKTKGNLTEAEASMLAAALYELRSRYIQTASSSRSGGGAM